MENFDFFLMKVIINYYIVKFIHELFIKNQVGILIMSFTIKSISELFILTLKLTPYFVHNKEIKELFITQLLGQYEQLTFTLEHHTHTNQRELNVTKGVRLSQYDDSCFESWHKDVLISSV